MMKNILFALFICPMLLCCKKKGVEGWQGSITATINGVDTSFNYFINCSRGISSASGTWSIYTSGFKTSGGDQISINVRNSGAVIPGVYNQTDSSKNAFLEYNQKNVHFPFMSSKDSANRAIVTITSVSDDHVEGIFSGEFYLLEYVNGFFYFTSNKKMITNGKFNIRFQ